MTTNPADPLRHTPPHNLEAEQAVLGGVMLKSSVLAELVDMLAPEDFYYPAHQLIYRAMLDLRQASQPVDMSTVAGHLASQAKLEDVNGAPYIAEVACSVVSAANATYHAQHVKECAVRRGLIEQAQAVISGAHNPTVPLDDLHGQASAMVIGAQMSEAKRPENMAELVDDYLVYLDRLCNHEIPPGLATGYGALDNLTGCVRRSELVVIAACTANGKTALALNAAVNMTLTGAHGGIFSMEMQSREMLERIFSRCAGVYASKLRRGDLDDMERYKIQQKAAELRELPLRISDITSLTPARMMERARTWKSNGGLDFLVVDYMQLLKPDGGQRGRSRENEVSAIARGCKEMAMELDCAVIALSQVNRGENITKSKNPRIALHNLRESGEIEQASNQIWAIQPWEPSRSHGNPTLELTVLKNRGGACGSCRLMFWRSTLDFRSASQ